MQRLTDSGILSEPPSSALKTLIETVALDPEAFEIGLALGEFFRSRGELERCVRLRTQLAASPSLTASQKVAVWIELGRDYHLAGLLDWAQEAFQAALDLAGPRPDILGEMAGLAARTGDLDTAAELHRQLAQPGPEAHFWARQARILRREAPALARELLAKALQAFPGSVEAWRETVLLDLHEGRHADFTASFEAALEAICPEHRFLLFQALAELPAGSLSGESLSFIEKTATALGQPLVSHFAGLILLASGERTRATALFELALDARPDFWAPRLELLALAAAQGPEASPVAEHLGHLAFFIDRARAIEPFVCGQCGMKRGEVFFNCPRCRSWHTISYRMVLETRPI